MSLVQIKALYYDEPDRASSSLNELLHAGFLIKPGFVTYVSSTKPISIVCNTEFENSRIFYVKSKRQASKALKLTLHQSWLTEFF